ncbi:hypothetical protein FSP39_009139 [Pinctada imbricata]|uniref:G-protein coupled receptors family 1 profile domain-containing protein n=1 Tax=Pinctada imbricata TaxID=66713 RepID=A0AA89C2Z8_PINIB|nr:hypothetical protein FSP39_002120 [Pinctada imbricata]KAK3097381.1 hypothetical protein FSP39_009139 [Pinctada imbricata]
MDYDYESYAEHQAGQWVWKVVPPIFIFLGSAGNLLSIVVLTRKSIRKSTTAIYLVVLAISDLLVLYTGLFRQWILALFDTDVRHVSSFGCKLHMFLVYFSLDFSGWILIAVTFERVVLVWIPHSAKSKCSRRTAGVILITILAFLFLLNGHMFFGNGDLQSTTGNETTTVKCTYLDNSYQNFFENTWPWIDLTIYCIVPFLSLFIGNILIVTKFLQSRRKLRTQVAPASASEQKNQKKTSSMTLMLFCLNTVYLISSVPISIYLIGYSDWVEPGDAHGQAVSNLLWSLFNVLMYANNTFNFLLYCLSGQKFRNEVKLILCRHLQRSQTNNSPIEGTKTQMNDATRQHI